MVEGWKLECQAFRPFLRGVLPHRFQVLRGQLALLHIRVRVVGQQYRRHTTVAHPCLVELGVVGKGCQMVFGDGRLAVETGRLLPLDRQVDEQNRVLGRRPKEQDDADWADSCELTGDEKGPPRRAGR